MHRCGIHDLDQWIGNVDVGGEGLRTGDSARVNWIGGGEVDRLHTGLWTGNDNVIGIRSDFCDAQPGSELAAYAGTDLYLPAGAHVKAKLKLAGDDLNHDQIARLADLLRSQVKGALAGSDVTQVNSDVDLVRSEERRVGKECRS